MTAGTIPLMGSCSGILSTSSDNSTTTTSTSGTAPRLPSPAPAPAPPMQPAQGRRKRQRPHEEAEAARVTEVRTTFFQRGRRARRLRQIVQFSDKVEQFMFFRNEEEEEQADETRSGNSTCTGWYTKLDYERMEQDAVSDAIQSRQEQGIPGVEEACAKAQRWGSIAVDLDQEEDEKNSADYDNNNKDNARLLQHEGGAYWSENNEECMRQSFGTELRARRSLTGRGLEHWTSMTLFVVRMESRRTVRHAVRKAQEASRPTNHQAYHHHPTNNYNNNTDDTEAMIAAASRAASRASRIYARFWGLADAAAAAAAETDDENASPLKDTANNAASNNNVLRHSGPKVCP